MNQKAWDVKRLLYTIRLAVQADTSELSRLRVQMDGETENFDREKGEAFLSAAAFEELIGADTSSRRNLFLVAVAQGRIVGFSRCEGTDLIRFSHKVEFGVGVLKVFWGYGIGKNLLRESILWADADGINKVKLAVLETNERAITLYKQMEFETEGVLKKDRMLSNGRYYSTVVMSLFHD